MEQGFSPDESEASSDDETFTPLSPSPTWHPLNNRFGKGTEEQARAEQAQKQGQQIDTDAVVIFSGRKYNWQAKTNLHIHIVEHLAIGIIELIVYNASNFKEADHVYLSSAFVHQRVEDPTFGERVEAVASEYQKHQKKIGPIPSEAISDILTRQAITTFILDRMHVVTRPQFIVDVKDSEKSYRMSNSGHSMPKPPEDSSIGHKEVVLTTPTSLSVRKPSKLAPSTVKRIGRSATLVGEVVLARPAEHHKEDEMLQQMIAQMKAAAAHPSGQARRGIMEKSSLLAHSKKFARRLGRATTGPSTTNLSGFHKFRNDTDLLAETLNYLHVSDWVEMMGVCKGWYNVLSNALRSASMLALTSREYYNHTHGDRDVFLTRMDPRDVHIRRLERLAMSSPAGRARQMTHGSAMLSEAEHQFVVDLRRHHDKRHRPPAQVDGQPQVTSPPPHPPALLPPRRVSLLKKFVMPETVQYLVRTSAKHLTELRLHQVVLCKQTIAQLAALKGRLTVLVLGAIKIFDPPPEDNANPEESAGSDGEAEAKPQEKDQPPSEFQAQRPSQPMPSTVSPRAATRETPKDSDVKTSKKKIKKLKINVERLRFMNGDDLCSIVSVCGMEITRLEVTFAVGELSLEVFRWLPKLQTLVALDSILATKLSVSTVPQKSVLDGSVLMQDMVLALQDIPMPHLLTFVAESANEAFLLTDRRGRIVSANAAWVQTFGHQPIDMYGASIEFLAGQLTTEEDFEVIVQGLKSQLRPEEITTFLHSDRGLAVLSQVILIPNLSKWKGDPLPYNCLESGFLEQMALDLEEGNDPSGSPTKRDWRKAQRELSYHLLRFGILSASFHPFQRPHTTHES